MTEDKTQTPDLSNKVIDNPNPIPEYILKEWIEKAKPLVDSAWNLAVDNCINVIREDYLEDSPLWNSAIDKKIERLTNLKKK